MYTSRLVPNSPANLSYKPMFTTYSGLAHQWLSGVPVIELKTPPFESVTYIIYLSHKMSTQNTNIFGFYVEKNVYILKILSGYYDSFLSNCVKSSHFATA